MKILLALVSIAFMSSCSLTHDSFSCGVSSSGVISKCIDFTGVTVTLRTSLEVACRGLGGDFNTSSCTEANRVGGCRHKNPSDQYTETDWYYAPMTPADAAGKCSSGEQFINADGTVGELPDMSVPVDLTTTTHD